MIYFVFIYACMYAICYVLTVGGDARQLTPLNC